MVKMGEHPFKFMYKRKDLTHQKKKKNTHTHTTTHNLAFQMKSIVEKKQSQGSTL